MRAKRCVAGGRVRTLRWPEVKEAAVVAFRIWTDRPEIHWAKEAWRHLQKAGLTQYHDETERRQVAMLLLTLAQIYSDWCDVAFEVRTEPDLPLLVEMLGVQPAVFLKEQQASKEGDSDWSCEDFRVLVDEARPKVVAALRTGFGGDGALLGSLWRSTQAPRKALRDDLGNRLSRAQSDSLILNTDVTFLKCRAYEWVRTGCSSYGP